eukprot:5486154-Pyramimonas_sp.AAC.1
MDEIDDLVSDAEAACAIGGSARDPAPSAPLLLGPSQAAATSATAASATAGSRTATASATSPIGARPAAAQLKLMDHFLLDRNEGVKQRSAKAYHEWISAVETATVVHHGIPQDTQARRCGRGRGYMIVWNRSGATPARAHMRHQLLEWWHLASTLLVRYQSIRRRGATAESVSLSKKVNDCLLYTSDAADDTPCVDL